MNAVAPTLQDFIAAAEQGGVVWVEGDRACGGAQVPAQAALLRGQLFDAIAAVHGDDAALLAWRESGCRADATSIPAATLKHALGCAESMASLSDARGQMLQLEYSATLLGRRFVALCRELGIAAAQIPLPQRQAIDEAMRREANHEPPAVRLVRHLMQPPLH